MKNLLDFITEHWLLISGVILAVGARLIPTAKNYDVLKRIVALIDLIIPNLKKGGGKHTIRIILFMMISNFCLAQTNGNFKSIRLTNGDSVQSGTADGTIFYNRVSNKFRFRQNGSWISIATNAGNLSGTLTANRVPYALNATTLTDNALFTFDPTNFALTMNGQRLSGSSTNTFLGPTAGNFTNSGATANIGIGVNSNDALTNGDNNTAVGGLSGTSINSGSNNTCIGYASGSAITTGSDNTVLGFNALVNATTVSNNIAIGSLALQTTTGGNNIQIGYGNPNITTGTNNIILGHDIDIATNTGSGQLNIQNIIYGTGNTATGTSISTGAIGIGTKAPLALVEIKGNAAGINLFRVVNSVNQSIMEVYDDDFADERTFIIDSETTNINAATTIRINSKPVPYLLQGNASLNFPSTAANSSSDLTFTLTGAEITDGCIVTTASPGSMPANCSYSAWVSAVNTINIRFNNYSTGAIDPTGGGTLDYYVTIIKNHP